MPFTVDFDAGDVVEWHADPDGGVSTTRETVYTPTVYVAGPEGPLDDLEAALESDPKVAAVARERWFLRLHADARSEVLRVDVERIGEVDTLAREVRGLYERDRYPPGTFRLYNVDFSPQFRYCLETDTDPMPARDLRMLEVRIGEAALAAGDLGELEIDGESLGGDEAAVLETLATRLARVDPDVLVVSHARLVELATERARELGVTAADGGPFRLGRRPGYTQLAGDSTFESYGRVGHSPARFKVPGRAIVDTSNSFMWSQTNLEGLFDLVRRSHKPLQETGWASIGNTLTAIQIREALDRGVLVPWNKWEPEAFKDVRTLHAADRGGFVFEPRVGLHEAVVEIDFASLYPRIICEHNISPDTVLCDCHAGRADVPELGYNVCDEPGFLPDVLGPILEDRAEIKRQIRAASDPAVETHHRKRSNALKWILVSCFGYQGYRNSKFGRIECHEAINAVARDVMLTAKAVLEAGGWAIVHGIVDSLWVTPRAGVPDAEREPLPELLAAVTDRVDIELEREARYDWVCFVPKRDSSAGALTKYFGKLSAADRGAVPDAATPADDDAGVVASGPRGGDGPPPGADGPGTLAGSGTITVQNRGGRLDSTSELADFGDAYKLRGIEARQRSTPAYVVACQRELIDALDEHREPAPVCDRLSRQLAALRAGRVEPADLLVRQRVSKPLGEYTQNTLAVAALRRAEADGLPRQPGQDVRYVVVDDGAARQPERVRLAHEPLPGYDADFYADLLVRAAESVVSPLGWDRERIRRYLRDTEAVRLDAFT